MKISRVAVITSVALFSLAACGRSESSIQSSSPQSSSPSADSSPQAILPPKGSWSGDATGEKPCWLGYLHDCDVKHVGYASNKIAISGDSAGGGLSVALMVALKNQKIEQPAGAVVFSPWVDLEGTGESMDSKASVDLMVDRHALALMANMFIAGGSLRDPLAAPLYADLAGIAPLYIQVGGDEALLDDSTRLATRAAHAGVPVRLEVFPEMQHVFQSGVGVIPEANDAVARAGQWLRGILA